jgi:large subunit ribosomal protein L4
MLKARYYQNDGSEGKAQALPEWLFDGVVHEDVLHQVIKAYLSNQRQGTASAKSRGEVRGGGRKPFRQKGTGRARQGTIRAAQMRGGGVAFPPIPHSWRQRVPRKVRALARRSAFNSRAQGDRVVLVDSFAFDTPKTKTLVEMLGRVGAEGKVLVLTDGPNANVYLSSRNLPSVEVRPFGDESAYDILWAHVLVIEKAALDNAEPSAMHRAAMESLSRGEPVVRSRERAAEQEQAERKKARPLREKHSRRVTGVVAEAEAPITTKEAPSKSKPKTKPKAKGAAKTEAKAEAAPEQSLAKSPGASESELDVATIKLPKVADMAEFLAQFDNESDIKALQARDSRKTVQTHYEVRLMEISTGKKG